MPNDNSTMGERKDIQKDIEAILGECVGDFKPEAQYVLNSEKTGIQGQALLENVAYNLAVKNIRSRIPETARKVLERVREEVERVIGTTSTIETNEEYMLRVRRFIASLAGEDEGDNGKGV